jgi:hypothetical protein
MFISSANARAALIDLSGMHVLHSLLKLVKQDEASAGTLELLSELLFDRKHPNTD